MLYNYYLSYNKKQLKIDTTIQLISKYECCTDKNCATPITYHCANYLQQFSPNRWASFVSGFHNTCKTITIFGPLYELLCKARTMIC